LVGNDEGRIVATIHTLLDYFKGFNNNSNPYGNGNAFIKIFEYLKK
jgi:hypothetical protein